MLLRWDLEHPGQFQVMPTPLPGWDGVEYMASVGLPTFRTASKDSSTDPANKPPVASGNSISVTAATTSGPLDLGAATLTAATSGARWRLPVTTTGSGPATPATITVKSALGQSMSAPITVK